MRKLIRLLASGIALQLLLAACGPAWAGEPLPPSGWTTASPRDAIRPEFAYYSDGGRGGSPRFVIEHADREGLDGAWVRTFPVTGGEYYRFQAFRRIENVTSPRRSAVVTVTWQNARGQVVHTDHSIVDYYRRGRPSNAAPEYPTDGQTDEHGWTEVSGTYLVPAQATLAFVQLHLRWAPNGRVTWGEIRLEKASAPPQRNVRLATVHFRPTGGGTPMGNCRLFAPLIEEAARQRADLVVLPETLTYYGTSLTYADVAEPVPGPSTDYFGGLARDHDLYIVAGLVERDGHLLYNVAVLIGPDGQVVGKYRKVCLPRGEVAGGLSPGVDYPVFDVRFGKLGMMVCYDGFFPEVARELTNRGAEVIAWPVWGCNPLLARARACENHVYLVSSTYTDVSENWIISGVFDHKGEVLTMAHDWGDVVVTEVDLNRRTEWSSLGDFKAEFPHHQPPPTVQGPAAVTPGAATVAR